MVPTEHRQVWGNVKMMPIVQGIGRFGKQEGKHRMEGGKMMLISSIKARERWKMIPRG